MVRFLLVEGHIIDNEHGNELREKIRQDLGYYLLLGMEFLVAADIIHTILNPSLEELAILGSIVAIRVVLSFFLQKELEMEDSRERYLSKVKKKKKKK